MTIDFTFILILAATILTGLLAGASLDKAIVQLPARHRMGVIGFAAFSKANDLGNGLIFYPVLGILRPCSRSSRRWSPFHEVLH